MPRRCELLVTGHSGEEVLAIERVEPGVGGRLHGRRTRHVAKQGDLAEEVSRAGRNDSVARVDRQLA
jgi:hypothetical protein